MKNDNPKRPYNSPLERKRVERKTSRGSTNDNFACLSRLYVLNGTIFPLACPQCGLELPSPDCTWMHFVLKHLFEEKRVYPDSFYEPFREAHRKQAAFKIKRQAELDRRARKKE